MASPFPGMDPYLESRSQWRGFHGLFISALCGAINGRLPRKYRAKLDVRLYVVQQHRNIFPDIATIQRAPIHPANGSEGGTAVAVATEEDDLPIIVTLDGRNIREGFIDIRRAGDTGEVVTTIEVLSPTNKTPGEDGELYLQKQEAVLDSAVNLLEIDLLRGGRYTVAVPEGSLPTDTPWDYLVCLQRASEWERFEVWPVPVNRRLPRIRVPLADGDPDIQVDLQAAFTRAYEEGAFDRDLDYRRDPVPPLTPADAAWADALLRERGLRN